MDLLESLKERTGNRIANDVATVTKSDAPSLASSAAADIAVAVQKMPHMPCVYNASAGRILVNRTGQHHP